jgi:hypothetical protein
MAIIKTAKYLIGTNSSISPTRKKTKFQGYANVEEMLAAVGFVETFPNKYKLANTTYGTRGGYPSCIKHIFLHHSATEMDKGTGNMINIFNSRGVASSHRGIDGLGNIETILEDKLRANCQAVDGYMFNTSGMSVELIALGWVKNKLQDDGTYLQGDVKIAADKTALAVDFNENPKSYKGFERFAAYTQPQVDATVKLIREWGKLYKIPFVFNQEQFNLMFPPKSKLNTKWLKNITTTKGVFTHNTVKGTKSDIFPDPLLIKTFKKEFAPGNSLDPANLK